MRTAEVESLHAQVADLQTSYEHAKQARDDLAMSVAKIEAEMLGLRHRVQEQEAEKASMASLVSEKQETIAQLEFEIAASLRSSAEKDESMRQSAEVITSQDNTIMRLEVSPKPTVNAF